jgi:hypothetical protein
MSPYDDGWMLDLLADELRLNDPRTSSVAVDVLPSILVDESLYLAEQHLVGGGSPPALALDHREQRDKSRAVTRDAVQ